MKDLYLTPSGTLTTEKTHLKVVKSEYSSYSVGVDLSREEVNESHSKIQKVNNFTIRKETMDIKDKNEALSIIGKIAGNSCPEECPYINCKPEKFGCGLDECMNAIEEICGFVKRNLDTQK